MEDIGKMYDSARERWNTNADEYLDTLDISLNKILEPLNDKIKDEIKRIIHNSYYFAQASEAHYAVGKAELFCKANQGNMDYINVEGDLYSDDFIRDIQIEIMK